MTESFPRQQARTRRFSLGVPRSFRVSPDGSRVAFLRSKTGTDPLTCLWQLHLPASPEGSAQEELVADPAALDAAEGDLPAAEKARRERVREQAGGIVSYATDRDLRVAVFALGGRVYVADLADLGHPAGPPRELPVRAPALDPRPDPDGGRIGYVSGGALHVLDVAAATDQVLADPDGQARVVYGLAEFIAAEEMD
ncbi:MAG TPA: S9 family peptidase, partial [Streptosporangiaceae bacterium]